MRARQFITGHVIYNPAYTYKFQLKTTLPSVQIELTNINQMRLLINFEPTMTT